MKPKTIFRTLTGIIVVAFSTVSFANTILDTTTNITQSDPTQWGRTSRNQIQQDWAGTEPFAGTINQEWLFHYHTYTITGSTFAQGGFIQIHLDDLGPNQANLFVSAYASSYDPTSQGTNWLGDAGTSGNFFGGTSPAFFQVFVPPATDLVITVWGTGLLDEGVGEPFRLLVEQFTDVTYSEPAPQPVLSTINVQASASQVKEGKKAVLTFTASPAPAQKTSVYYSPGGSAVIGTDYTLSGPAGKVVFSAGQTTATVTLTALKNSKPVNGKPPVPGGGNKTAAFTIQGQSSYLVGTNNSASVTILGN